MIWIKLDNGSLINYKKIEKIEGNFIYFNDQKIKFNEREMKLLIKIINKYDRIYTFDDFDDIE